MFTPEFRNRLDAVIPFAGLTPEIVGQVVDKFVMQLEAQLADRNVTIELSSAAKEWLAEKGYDPLYGARPLARVIQEYIKKPLAEELLFGKLAKGGSVKVGLQTARWSSTTWKPPPRPAEAGRQWRRRGREGPRDRRIGLGQHLQHAKAPPPRAAPFCLRGR